MSNYVEYRGKIVNYAVFDPALAENAKCWTCGDTGLVRETIDDARLPVMVPCHRCHPYCPTCKGQRPAKHKCEAK